MKKKMRLILISLCMILPLAGCQNETEENTPAITYRYADKEEGTERLLDNPEYYAGFSDNELEFRMEKKGASMDEYLAFAREQVMDFTDEQKSALDNVMKKINDHIAAEGYHLPGLDEVTFVLTTMKEEPLADAYTHKTEIYMGMAVPGYAMSDQSKFQEKAFEIMTHELFHTLSRNNPDFRRAMYEIIHFKVADHDFEIPPSAYEYYVSNPDVEHHNAYASFEIGGETKDCFIVLNTAGHFEHPTDSALGLSRPVLVPTDGSDTVYLSYMADNFDEIFGTNTDYLLDPEECMAVNFSYALTYGMEGPQGNGYPDPEIIEAIIDYLKGE